MTNIAGRLKKSEDLLNMLVPNEEDQKMFFIRFGNNFQGPPGEIESKWRNENPDYKGRIYICWIGSRSV
jgi:hypothetical protein